MKGRGSTDHWLSKQIECRNEKVKTPEFPRKRENSLRSFKRGTECGYRWRQNVVGRKGMNVSRLGHFGTMHGK